MQACGTISGSRTLSLLGGYRRRSASHLGSRLRRNETIQSARVRASEENIGRRRQGAVKTFVALMRGINVGSTRKLPMAELRALAVKNGLQRPETYIQSGNLIVDAGLAADAVRTLLEKAIA